MASVGKFKQICHVQSGVGAVRNVRLPLRVRTAAHKEINKLKLLLHPNEL